MDNIINIKVVGVGGGGCNAVNRMIAFGVNNVDFVAINTDVQALEKSRAEVRLQIGNRITRGQGAGSKPSVGRAAAEESKEVLEEILTNADMVFVTAGMGGGTGTGAAPVVAKIAKDKGILTVGVVTTPFGFEGDHRMTNANEGVKELIQAVDTLLIIPNNKLSYILPEDVSVDDSFCYADETLRQAIQGTADLIQNAGNINLDFADVCAVMRDQGLAHMGVGFGEGENRVLTAIQQAVSSPLLDTTIDNATSVIVNIAGGTDLKLSEASQSADLIRQVIAKDANYIFGCSMNERYNGKVLATVIATGFDIPTSNSTLRLLASSRVPKPVPPQQAALKRDLSTAPTFPAKPSAVAGERVVAPTVKAIDPSATVAPPPTRVDAEINVLPPWLRNRINKHDGDDR